MSSFDFLSDQDPGDENDAGEGLTEVDLEEIFGAMSPGSTWDIDGVNALLGLVSLDILSKEEAKALLPQLNIDLGAEA